MSALSFFSLVTAPLQVISAGGLVLSRATCFFYRQDENWSYLVTNWHVVTGRDPMLPQKSKTGAVPVRLRLTLHKNVGGKTISRTQKVACNIEINDVVGNAPSWFEHPAHKFKVDLVVIKIKNDDKFRVPDRGLGNPTPLGGWDRDASSVKWWEGSVQVWQPYGWDCKYHLVWISAPRGWWRCRDAVPRIAA